MPKVAYSEEDRERIREALVAVALELMARQGIQHTTVEQIYKTVGHLPHLLLHILSHQGRSDRGGSLSPAAADPGLRPEPGRRSCAYLEGRSRKISAQLLLWREKRHRGFDCRGAAADLPPPVPGELPDLPGKAGAAVRRDSGELRHQGRSSTHRPLYQSEPHRHDRQPRHSSNTASVCAGGR